MCMSCISCDFAPGMRVWLKSVRPRWMHMHQDGLDWSAWVTFTLMNRPNLNGFCQNSPLQFGVTGEYRLLPVFRLWLWAFWTNYWQHPSAQTAQRTHIAQYCARVEDPFKTWWPAHSSVCKHTCTGQCRQASKQARCAIIQYRRTLWFIINAQNESSSFGSLEFHNKKDK